MKAKSAFSSPLTKFETVFGLVYLLFHVFLLPDLLYLALSPILGRETMSGPWLTFIYYLVGAAAVLTVARRFMKDSFGRLWDEPLRTVSAVAGGYLVYYGLLYIISVFILTVSPGITSNPNNDLVEQSYMQLRGVMTAAAVFLAPITEEFLFRGVIFGKLRRHGRVLAYAVSAAAFALYHLWQFLFTGTPALTFLLYLLQYLPGSIALAWAYERTGSIWTPVFLHMLINWFALSAS